MRDALRTFRCFLLGHVWIRAVQLPAEWSPSVSEVCPSCLRVRTSANPSRSFASLFAETRASLARAQELITAERAKLAPALQARLRSDAERSAEWPPEWDRALAAHISRSLAAPASASASVEREAASR